MAWKYTVGEEVEKTLDFKNLYVDSISKYIFQGVPEKNRSEIVKEMHKAFNFVNEQLEKRLILIADNGNDLRVVCRLRPFFEDGQRHMKVEGEMYLRPGLAEIKNDRIIIYKGRLPETVIERLQLGKIIDDFVAISILSGKKITGVIDQPVKLLVDLEPTPLEKWSDAIKGPGWP